MRASKGSGRAPLGEEVQLAFRSVPGAQVMPWEGETEGVGWAAYP